MLIKMLHSCENCNQPISVCGQVKKTYMSTRHFRIMCRKCRSDFYSELSVYRFTKCRKCGLLVDAKGVHVEKRIYLKPTPENVFNREFLLNI